MWITPEKRETSPKKGRNQVEKGRIDQAHETLETRTSIGFPRSPRASARKNKKKQDKNHGLNAACKHMALLRSPPTPSTRLPLPYINLKKGGAVEPQDKCKRCDDEKQQRNTKHSKILSLKTRKT